MDKVFEKRARYLGYAGLLPFGAALAMLALGPIGVRELSLRSLLTYSAVILSFMGAVHWGRAMYQHQAEASVTRANGLCISVIPALIGWSAIFFAPRIALVLLAIAFFGLYLFERGALKDDNEAQWYLPLRLRLTAVVVGTLLLAAVLL